jgi:dihydroorotase
VELGGSIRTTAKAELDAKGLTVLPGVIDSQVHFREPGLEHKEDLATGTAAAACGGVTTIFEMPNTKPNTDTAERLHDKLNRAEGRAWVNYAFFIGATAENASELDKLELLDGCSGVKVFMGSSTGSLLVADQQTLIKVLRCGRRRVAVHCEDEPRLIERQGLVSGGASVTQHPVWRDEETALRATSRLLTAAQHVSRPVHVLHVTTAQEMQLLARHKDIATVEVTPQHLTLFAPDCYERLGSHAQMNPPIRDEHHRASLWHAVREGVVDVLGSDHAPHTLAEKAQAYPASPSGMPGVQTLLPLMLNHVAEGRLSLERLVDLVCSGPARIYNMSRKGRIAVGYDADLTLVDLDHTHTITAAEMKSKAGFTPFEGMRVKGWPTMTVVRGQVVMRDGELLGTAAGKPVRFWDVPREYKERGSTAPPPAPIL